MTIFPRRMLAPIAVSLMLASSVVVAQTHPCAQIADPDQRLACYDKAFPPSPEVQALSLEEQRKKAVAEFGLSGAQKLEREPKEMRDLRPDRIEATIKTIFTNPTGERIVTLDNGQSWYLPEVTSNGRLAAGDEVVIRTAAMGTFMLVTPHRIALRAKRLQ